VFSELPCFTSAGSRSGCPSFCIVQRATAQSKTGFFRFNGVAEAPPGFQASWSDCMLFLFSLFLFILLSHLEFSCKFFAFMRVHCYVGAQPTCIVVKRSVSLWLRSALKNRKQHAIDFDQPQYCAI
jgi:hypothetical protein